MASTAAAPPQAGLTTAEARARLDQYGPNEPVPRHGWSFFGELLSFFSNPLVLILLLAAAASLLLGQRTDAIIVFVMVLISVAINFTQTYRSQVAAEQLRGQVAASATVLRDGVWSKIPRSEVVPGDVVQLAGGDLV